MTDRFEVTAPDGVSLAVWVEGHGPPLVLVHGSMQDHTGLALLLEALHTDMTTFALDRRGFGGSADAGHYSIEAEFSDVAAVLDTVAARTGGPVALWGHSYGANCAMGGAARSSHVSHLVLYEPSLGLTYPPGSIEAVEAAIASGDQEEALLIVLRDALELATEDIDAIRATPTWPSRVATAPTIPREMKAEENWSFHPGQFDAVSAPTLFLSGSESPASMKKATDDAASAITTARVRVLEGHAHLAHRTDPALVAGIVTGFCANQLS